MITVDPSLLPSAPSADQVANWLFLMLLVAVWWIARSLNHRARGAT